MFEKSLNGCLGLLLTLVAAGALFPRQASSLVLTVFPPAELPDIDQNGNPRVSRDPLAKYLNLIELNGRLREESLSALRSDWRPTEIGLLLETLPFISDPRTKMTIYEILRAHAKQSLPDQLPAWRAWFRESQIPEDPRSSRLNSVLFGQVSPLAGRYFHSAEPARIRFDWIEVGQRFAEFLRVAWAPDWKSSVEAAPVDESSLVYGIECGGCAFACPQAAASQWDAVRNVESGREFLFAYDSATGAAACFPIGQAPGAPQLVATGLRYDQALLLADEATGSLWLSDTGEAVSGPMASQQRKLEPLPVSKVAWKTWLEQHPNTRVLMPPTTTNLDQGDQGD